MDYMQLSKEVSYALRHAPWEYELEMDDQGWVRTEQLLEALKRKHGHTITRRDLEHMVRTSDKKRHEMADERIRAHYGHSLPHKIEKVKSKPPRDLFHGTAEDTVEMIREHGLRPMQRQYVHLSIDRETAEQVGKRKGDRPVVLQICAGKAWDDGVPFYRGNDKVWLADGVPPSYIQTDDREC